MQVFNLYYSHTDVQRRTFYKVVNFGIELNNNVKLQFW